MFTPMPIHHGNTYGRILLLTCLRIDISTIKVCNYLNQTTGELAVGCYALKNIKVRLSSRPFS